MATTPVDDLKKVREALVQLRRREAAQIVNEGGELATYAAGILRTTTWIDAVDKAVQDEQSVAEGVTAGGTRPRRLSVRRTRG